MKHSRILLINLFFLLSNSLLSSDWQKIAQLLDRASKQELAELKVQSENAAEEVKNAQLDYNQAYYTWKTTRKSIEDRRIFSTLFGTVIGFIAPQFTPLQNTKVLVFVGAATGLIGSELLTQWYKIHAEQPNNIYDQLFNKKDAYAQAKRRYYCKGRGLHYEKCLGFDFACTKHELAGKKCVYEKRRNEYQNLFYETTMTNQKNNNDKT